MLELFNNNQPQVTFDPSMFEIDKEKGMVNLTKIAKHFGKDVFDWQRLPSTKAFLDAFDAKNPNRENLGSVRGGNDPSLRGVWGHRKIAIKFAQWISPEFEVWCIDQLDELFQTGSVSLDPMQQFAEAVLLAQRVIAEKENTIKQLAPKADYCDKVLQSEILITTSIIAADLGMSAKALNKTLHAKGIIYNIGNTWLLYAKHQGKGYTHSKTHHFTHSDGTVGTTIHTYWTEKGRMFIHEAVGQSVIAA